MKAYKGFDKNLCCRKFQFEIGKTYYTGFKDDELEICSETVFHYCKKLEDVNCYYGFGNMKNRYCEIEILGGEVQEEEKFGSNKIKIIREISLKDYYDELICSENWSVRCSTSKRYDLTPNQVEKLVNDEDYTVRWKIAKRNDLTANQIEKLVNDEDWCIRYEMAKRYDLTPEQVEKLVNDENASVRLEIAKRNDLTPKQIEKLVKDEDWCVICEIKKKYIKYE